MNKLEFLQSLSGSFITKKRSNGETFRLIDDEKAGDLRDQFRDLSMHCHEEMMPDDHKYQMIENCCDALLENDYDEEEARIALDQSIPVYNSDLLQWVASNLTRAEYVDQAMAEFECTELFPALGWGYMIEQNEVFNLMIQWLDDNIQDDA